MLTLMGNLTKGHYCYFVNTNHDFVPCFMKNPKDIAASWLKFLFLPRTISTWNQRTMTVPLPLRLQNLSCPFLLLKISRLKHSLIWLASQYHDYSPRHKLVVSSPLTPCGYQLSTTSTQKVGNRLQPRVTVHPALWPSWAGVGNNLLQKGLWCHLSSKPTRSTTASHLVLS
jgi:hypothetical protein